MAETKISKSAQDFVPIKEIRDGVLILKDGSLRMILMASSLNFALKSADEQNAILLQYQNFLNSLDFSVQFFVESRALNIEPYIDTLKETLENQTNELLTIQTKEYIEFVKNFVKSTNIVSKSFYIVVPYNPSLITISRPGIGGILEGVLGKKSRQAKTMEEERFEEYRIQLWQRANIVSQGLIRTGVRIAALNTEELIELFYGLFNPGEAEKGKAPQTQ